MTIESVISLALWVPFALVLLVTGIGFCITGCRRGLLRSLISLGATAAAALLSLLLARVACKPLGKALWDQLRGYVINESTAMAEDLIFGLMNAVLAVMLFSVFFFFLVILCKALSGLLLKNRKGMWFGGLAVRLVDAVLYTLLLLLPLYGTLAVYAPAVQTVVAMLPEGQVDPQIENILAILTGHPVTRLSRNTPVMAVYQALSGVETENGTLDTVSLVTTMNEIIQLAQEIREDAKNGQFDPAKADLLVKSLRENAIDQKWCYTAYLDLVDILATAANQASEDQRLQQLLALMDMDRASFQKNASAILDTLEYALQPEVFTALSQEGGDTVSVLYATGLMDQVGKMINTSQESTGLRDLILHSSLQDSPWAELLSGYTGQLHTDPLLQRQDAEVMLLLTGGGSELDTLAALLRLPGISREAAKTAFLAKPMDTLFPDLVQIQQVWKKDELIREDRSCAWDDLADYLGDEAGVQETVWHLLEENAAAPISSGSVQTAAEKYLMVSAPEKMVSYGGRTMTGSDLLQAVERLGEDYFRYLTTQKRLYSGNACYALLLSCGKQMASGVVEEIYGSENSLWTVVSLMEKCVRDGSDALFKTDDLYVLYGYFWDDAAYHAISALVQSNGENPLDLYKNLNKTERKWLETMLDPEQWSLAEQLFIYEYETEGGITVAEKCRMLRQFFGIAANP